MDVATQHKYESIMRTEIDIIAQKAWAREEGKAEGRAEGLAEGLAEGEAKGAEDKARSIARSLRNMQLSPEQIAKATGLSVEAIAAL